ncbi:GNAT family N-acetyltransferase [Candidatus Bathyarchaeota archaeon]|nr:GNAT family N-acetyltransferase [Candidatus Bathyarchaeota archaeon]
MQYDAYIKESQFLPQEDFTFAHLETENEIREYLKLMRKVFGDDPAVELMIKKFLYAHPKMMLKNHFVMKHRKKIVAGLILIPVNWSVEDIPLKTAEMGCVATLEEYRNQGLMRRLIGEYHRQVDAEGYDLSVIEGIPYFYHQFGYSYALALNEETAIPLQRIRRSASKLKIRPFTFDDIAEAAELLEQTQKKFLVHCSRDKQIWRMQQETGIACEYQFESFAIEEHGKMLAYFRINQKPEEKKLILREVTDASQAVNNAILSFLKNYGRKHGLDTLVSQTSYHDS